MYDSSLFARQLHDDPRVKKAKELLAAALEDHQKKMVHVRPPQKHLVMTYQQILDSLSEYRGAKLYFPYIGSGFGNGVLVELLDGSIKYDFISGIGSHYWGHNHPDLLLSGIDAALSDTVMQGHLQQNFDSLELSEMLSKASGMDHVFLTSSGAMANENALKLAFQKKSPANRILAFEHCFMGRTLALSQISDKPAFREGLPLTYFVDYVPFYQPDKPEESTHHAVTILRQHLARYPKQHAVMCFELIHGEGGFYPGSSDFFKTLMSILKEHHITIFVDEIQTFGRTTSLFAFHYFKLEEYVDIVTIGKLSQVCATLFKNEFKPRPNLLSQTFTSSTAAIRAGKLILYQLMHHQYFGENGKIAQIHRYFVESFKKIESTSPHLIRGPYGIGAMIAFTPLDGEASQVAKFVQDLFHAGVISFVAGSHPTRVRFLVPIGAIRTQDIDQVMKIVEEVLKKS